MRRSVFIAAIAVASAMAWGQPSGVVHSPHNLSAGGPGAIRAVSESEVCIFCHAPHNASPVKPLWNRVMPLDSYSVYTSRSLDALPGQPTGTSKMCLSCHDGTIALGNVFSRATPILMAGGVTTMPQGPGHIGTDLRDDHPISFRFDNTLASRDPKLRRPGSLPSEIRLDPNGELQCTACHDAHNNANGDFLVMRNENSQLCVACHQVGVTAITAHASCSACHQPHSAPSGPYLLKRANITDTCLMCHNGSVQGAADIAPDLRKVNIHDSHSPIDADGQKIKHTSCVSCHDPHTMSKGAGTATTVHPNFGRVAGVNGSAAPVMPATSEYEVCFRCHADSSPLQPLVMRKIVQNNTRLEFAQNAASSHPVTGPGRNTEVPSLRPGWTTSSVMYCSHCHGSETGRSAGGTGPSGIHGSNYPGLLVARYETLDGISENASVYALCYRCHDRTNLLDDRSFPLHRKHIVDKRTPCSDCHDAHGISSSQGNISNNSNLMNFNTNVVFPDRRTGRLEFRDTGRFRGECYLTCHGVDHSPKRYPD